MMVGTSVAGFADPALGAQAAFRCLLEAIAHPGRIVPAPANLPKPPAPLLAPTFAAALTLLDFETPLFLDDRLGAPAVLETLRLQCGCPIAPAPEASFALLARQGLPLAAFSQGTPEYPDRSATLIWQVADLANDRGVLLTGPGIKNSTRLHIEGVPLDFWAQWTANHQQFPLGVDIVLVTADRLAALPRSIEAEV